MAGAAGAARQARRAQIWGWEYFDNNMMGSLLDIFNRPMPQFDQAPLPEFTTPPPPQFTPYQAPTFLQRLIAGVAAE